jgi:hypothetical protein
VNWIAESTNPHAATARALLNSWYADFPDATGTFAARLQSATGSQHLQGVDELFIHHLLRANSDDVRYEEGGTGPDFRVYRDGACSAAVEVVSLFQQAEWSDEAAPHQRLADELNDRVRPSAGYFVSFDIEVLDRDPSPRRFAEFVEHEIQQLPPPEDLRLPSPLKPDDLPSATYETDGVRIRVRFIPMRSDAPARTDPDARIVGMGATVGGWVATADRLKERVGDKAGGRYEISEVPFLVAVGVHEAICEDFHVFSALYGGPSISLAGEIRQRNDGLFGVDRTHPDGRNRRVSAVTVVREFYPWLPEKADIATFHNPYGARPWPTGILSTRNFSVVERGGSGVRLDWC